MATKRYTFTAPSDDKQIAEWINRQHSFSTSIRIVIKDYISKYGMIDISCLPMALTDEPSAVSRYNDELETANNNDMKEQTNKNEEQTENKPVNKEDDMLASLMN